MQSHSMEFIVCKGKLICNVLMNDVEVYFFLFYKKNLSL